MALAIEQNPHLEHTHPFPTRQHAINKGDKTALFRLVQRSAASSALNQPTRHYSGGVVTWVRRRIRSKKKPEGDNLGVTIKDENGNVISYISP